MAGIVGCQAPRDPGSMAGTGGGASTGDGHTLIQQGVRFIYMYTEYVTFLLAPSALARISLLCAQNVVQGW